MSARAVLLSDGKRNKVVKIPPGVNHLTFLRNVVKETFLKVEESHGGAKVYFQKYDTEWEEWVDVDEDFVAETKDKLKVVTSTLVTDLGSEREEENLEMTPRTGTAITISENSSNPVYSTYVASVSDALIISP